MSQDTPPPEPAEPSETPAPGNPPDTVRTPTWPPRGSPSAATQQPEGGTERGQLAPDPTRPEPRLHREAVVLVHDRGRFAVLVALCTLAGVAVGFVLGSFTGASGTAAGDGRAAGGAGFSVMPDTTGRHDCVPPAAMPGAGLWRHGVDIWDHDPGAWLGVNLDNHYKGARVTDVNRGSAAATAGIVEGDIVISVDGESVAAASQLARIIRGHKPGDKIEITLDRAGDEITLQTKLGERAARSHIRIR